MRGPIDDWPSDLEEESAPPPRPIPARRRPIVEGGAVETVRPWTRWQDWANVILGGWLFISPWVLGVTGNAGTYNATNGAVVPASSAGYATTNPWNAWLVGAIVFVVALAALAAPMSSWPQVINIGSGAWLFISPWLLGYTWVPNESWDAWIVGVMVVVAAIWALVRVREANAHGPSGIIGYLSRRRRTPTRP